MSEYAGKRFGAHGGGHRAGDEQVGTPGKQTLVEQVYGPTVQLRASPAETGDAGAGEPRGAAAPASLPPRGDVIQRMFGRPQASAAQAEPRPNRSGLPDGLKAGVESLSGMSMDGVRVHYNSGEPSKVNALAYAQGGDIHLGPGQEHHLPHEAWHVVQQAQGRVSPTRQMKGGAEINDDHGLEHEADVMGDRAASMGAADAHPGAALAAMPASAAPVQRRFDSRVLQRVLATINPQNGPVNLQQVGGGVGGGFVVMQNATQPAGQDVNNTVGFTGVMNGEEWAGLGKTATEYWRAHAYANSFGGAGDITNVGWWRATAEDQWTGFEQQVRGAGQNAIAAWQPGVGETGTYLVERELFPQIQFIGRYVTGLMAAVTWAFDDSRAAWQRALATCDTIGNKKDQEKRKAALAVAKQTQIGLNQNLIQNWVTALFGGGNPVETNLIKKMKMTYAITAAGANPGASRANLTKTVSSAEPKPNDFGLKNEPSNIWTELVNHNNGVFGHGNAPSNAMARTVAYDNDPYKPGQELRAHADGFGVA